MGVDAVLFANGKAAAVRCQMAGLACGQDDVKTKDKSCTCVEPLPQKRPQKPKTGVPRQYKPAYSLSLCGSHPAPLPKKPKRSMLMTC